MFSNTESAERGWVSSQIRQGDATAANPAEGNLL